MDVAAVPEVRILLMHTTRDEHHSSAFVVVTVTKNHHEGSELNDALDRHLVAPHNL